jgi:hypothetical protein
VATIGCLQERASEPADGTSRLWIPSPCFRDPGRTEGRLMSDPAIRARGGEIGRREVDFAIRVNAGEALHPARAR